MSDSPRTRDAMDYFLELFGGLPRAGPGDDASTRRALDLVPQLPANARVLDVGSGPGRQTTELLRNTAGARVVALDLLPSMTARAHQAVRAAGLEQNFQMIRGDMNRMPFQGHSFDLVWSEAAIYILGFERGLEEFGRYVKPGGHLVVSEVVWLKQHRPRPLEDFWSAYPEIDTVEGKLQVTRRLNLDVLGHFILPPSSWTDDFYDPLRRRIAHARQTWPADPAAAGVLAEAQSELDLFDRYQAYYTYAFFCLRVPGGG